MSEEYKQNSRNLFKKYAPIERDPSIPPEVKANHMKTWWEESSNLIINERLSKRRIKVKN